jgi:flavin reductase (DIM6/NTAB) family NADH-FMN oxidoreductase RutF
VSAAADAFDRDVFRDVIGHFATGVAIVTTRDGDDDYGVTVSALTSVSLDPPMLLVCLNQSSRTQAAIKKRGAFVVNVLSDRQGSLALMFASRSDDKFAAADVSYGERGLPLIGGSLAHVECNLVDEAHGGTHTVFLADVVNAEGFAGDPLAYYRGKFGRFQGSHEELVATVDAPEET